MCVLVTGEQGQVNSGQPGARTTYGMRQRWFRPGVSSDDSGLFHLGEEETGSVF